MARGEITGKKPGVSADLIERRSGPPQLGDDEPTQHGEPAALVAEPLPPIRSPPDGPTPLLALTIPQFCEAFNISEGFYYKLKKQRLGPREMKVGARTLITIESARAWGRERERITEAEDKAKTVEPKPVEPKPKHLATASTQPAKPANEARRRGDGRA